METTPARYVSDTQLEKLYSIKKRTWEQWRFRGKGPRYCKVGRLVRYDLRDVEAWLERDKTNGDGTRLAA